MTAGKQTLFQSLRQTAERAAESDPGPWEFDGRDIFTRSHIGAAPHHLIVPLPETWHESQRVPVALAQHIAQFDPTTVLLLLDVVEAARRLDRSHRGDERVLAWAALSDKLRAFDWGGSSG